MNERIDSEHKNIKYYSEAIKKAENADLLTFLQWFNGGQNINTIINSGYHDFYNNILKNYVYSATKNISQQLTALEIGCGGGRIINAACKYFKNAIGVDIHDSFSTLEKFLQLENNNFQLFKIEDNKIPVENNSVDLVYSFIVFQHILKIKTFEDYIAEIQRILTENGIAIIYFGRPRFFSKYIFKSLFVNKITFLFDKLFYENIFLNIFKKGYYENYQAKVNHVNLVVSKWKAAKIFRKRNLKIKEFGNSKIQNGFGTQYYFIVTK
jgi:SAM-dependent methyltransferase